MPGMAWWGLTIMIVIVVWAIGLGWIYLMNPAEIIEEAN